MPEHTSWFTLLLAHMHETLDQNAQAFGETVIQHEAPSWRSFEPMAAALFVTLLVLGIALRVRARLQNPDDAQRQCGGAESSNLSRTGALS